MFAEALAPGRLEIPGSGLVLHLRAMLEEDLAEVVQIEEQLFRSAWTAEMFREDFDQEYACPLVARDRGRLAAYLVAYVVADEIHIANIAVAPEYQRRGVGYAFLLHLLRVSREAGYALAHLEVRRSNAAAIALYEKLGFAKVGLRKEYYEIEHEDAVLMTCLIQVNPLFATPDPPLNHGQ
ncbi:MAG TPA: ribosomal protein S18-alanine N-acetyltransferase [bacterium]|nr:ribosomal protein S18-alanine N-acetyltransferase [bacterium]HQG46053.1 ribosomal protein S18-alanine N-acetyltransferase [bacterium]HQI49441.1 ribosomal protein S18-alanine N-acetyltransferase [bacterium]HQJ66223.1 ribosomal protein S18-alanine N-acetyltransferase [bacterium]